MLQAFGLKNIECHLSKNALVKSCLQKHIREFRHQRFRKSITIGFNVTLFNFHW